jgi:hypothetical protein
VRNRGRRVAGAVGAVGAGRAGRAERAERAERAGGVQSTLADTHPPVLDIRRVVLLPRPSPKSETGFTEGDASSRPEEPSVSAST